MFDKIRHPGRRLSLRTIIAYIIFGVICVVFVFFGMMPFNETGSGGMGAATVNNTIISIDEFRQNLDRIQESYRGLFSQLPETTRQKYADTLRDQAVNQLIQRELLAEQAARLGIIVTDAEIRDLIVGIEAFQKDGRFQRDRYMAYLEQEGLTPGRFEDRIRRERAGLQLAILLGAGFQSTGFEQRLNEDLRGREINLEFVRIAPTENKEEKKSSVAAGKIKDFLVNSENLKKVESYYKENEADYQIPEEVRARHILAKFEAGNAKSEGEALERVSRYQEELKEKDFAELAGQVSDDLGSKEKKGDLGYFGRGKMVREFEDAAFGLKVGETSGPVKSNFGYHLIRLEDRRGGGVRSLVEVQNEIAEKLIREDELTQAKSRLAEAASAGDVKAIEKVAQAVGLKKDETGYFDLEATSIPKLRDWKVMNSLWKSLRPKSVASELIEVDGVSHVVWVKDVKGGAAKTDGDKNPARSLAGLSNPRFNSFFDEWMKQVREKSRVSLNPALFAARAESTP